MVCVKVRLGRLLVVSVKCFCKIREIQLIRRAKLHLNKFERVTVASPRDPEHALINPRAVVQPVEIGVHGCLTVVVPPGAVSVRRAVAARPQVVVGVERRELHAERVRQSVSCTVYNVRALLNRA